MASHATSKLVGPARILLLVCAGALAACVDAPRANDPASEPVTGGTAVVVGSHDLQNLNPLVVDEQDTAELLKYALFTTLVRFDSAFGYQPYLAESWEEAGDTAIVFHLRRDVRWHDGRPTTAEDVAFTFRRVKDPGTASSLVHLFENWVDVTVVDSHTARFKLRPHADPLYPWTELPVVPAHALDSVPPAEMRRAAFNGRPIGNGPFRLGSHRENDRWVFEANDEFPADLGGRPNLDRVVWRSVPESEAQVVELLTGNAQFIMSPRTAHVPRLEGDPAVRVLRAPTNSYAFLGWNTASGPLSDVRVRRALTLAIDRRAILDGLREGYGTIAIGPVPPSHWAYHDRLEPLSHDTATARELLDAAGWQDRDSDGVREDARGRPLRIRLKVPAGVDYSRDLAQVVQAHLARVGVQLEPVQLEPATLFADITAEEKRFEGVLLTLAGDFRLDLRDTYHSRAIGQPYQLSSWSHPRADALMDSLAATGDREEALPLWHRLQEVLHDEQPWTFLYYAPALRGASTRLHGVTVDARGTLVTLPSWWLEPASPAGDRR